MGAMSIWHWLIVLVIVLLVFGTKRLTGLGSDLGNAIKGFRAAMKDGEAEDQAGEPQPAPEPAPEPPVVEAEPAPVDDIEDEEDEEPTDGN